MKAFFFKRYIALILILGIILAPFIVFITRVNAGTFTAAKLTISDSRAGLAATSYDFAFTATANTAVKSWTIQFCTTASGTCTTPTGIVTTGATLASDNFGGTGRTNTFTSNGTLTTSINTPPGTLSSNSLTASYTGITNPTTADTSFFARIATYTATPTLLDSATVAAAILTSTSIAVTASVDSTFTFTVAAVTSGGLVNGATTNVTTTANTVPFGVLAVGTPNIAAHDLTVATNAIGGYTVTIKGATNPVLVDAGDNIDEFTGTNTTPTTWSAPNGTAANVNTGFFGYTTADATLATGTVNRFTSGGPKWAGTTTSPLEVVYNSAAPSGGTETTRIGYEAQVNNLQPFGTYSGTIILVATPTY